MEVKYSEIGICGLSCRLCPHYQSNFESKCLGCKSSNRMAVGCPFITCIKKKQGIEFCGDCPDNLTCQLWKGHREYGKRNDTFVCYQKLESNIDFIKKYGSAEFENVQKLREQLLIEMLQEFNEGRSKSYYCIVSTILEINEIKAALIEAKKESNDLDIKAKSKLLHSIIDKIAAKKGYNLKLRKYVK